MSNINIVVCAEKTEYKVALKNKITSDELSIIGYADFQPFSFLTAKILIPISSILLKILIQARLAVPQLL